MSVILGFPVRFLTRCTLFFILLFSFSACFYKKPHWTPPQKNQRFVDKTQRYLPRELKGIAFGIFTAINRDLLSDLVLIPKQMKSKDQILTYIIQGRKKYRSHLKNGLNRDLGMDVEFIQAGDFNQDRFPDLILLGASGNQNAARLLLNNKKGYYYLSRYSLPPVKNGVERVEAVDIDHDGDKDLLFFGKTLREVDGRLAPNNVQLMINQGKGRFEDLTRILLPHLPKGMVAASIADYDGDGVLDIFWVQTSGKNALWINNGLGRFSDHSNRSLPLLAARYAFADWADFDMDGDNDLLLVTRGIPNQHRAYKNEFCFFLQNDGRGIFKKRSLRLLPSIPSHRVYLLDADANGIPDILILSRRGVHFLIGQSPWKFSDETVKRLPFSAPFDEMIFGDVNGDGNLDIFGILSENKTGRLWVDRLN